MCRLFERVFVNWVWERNLPIEEIMVAPQNHIDLAKNGMEYMLQTKGYDADVSLSNIKLRY